MAELCETKTEEKIHDLINTEPGAWLDNGIN